MKRKQALQLLLTVCWPVVIGLYTGSALANPFGLAVYGGQLTKEKWEQAISPGAEFADATIFVIAGSWRFCRLLDDKLSLEMEAQVGRYFGEQKHWEFNLPIVGFRWHGFPWNRILATSFAWGIGPSYATRVPEVELETNDDSSHWLIYWFGELSFGPPTASWEALLRLHHRSDGFGTVSDDGGSNAVCAGLRFHF